MIEIAGKQIPNTLAELVDPHRTALILVDIQNDYCAPGGKYALAGYDMTMYPPMVERTIALVECARQNNSMIIYIQNSNLPDYRSDSVAYLRFKLILRGVQPGELRSTEHALEGTWGQQIVDALAPRPGALVVKKHRASAFVNTQLDLLLRSNQVQTVLITGVVTQGCVFSTALDASFNDYIVVIVEDCIGSSSPRLHEAALELMRTRFDFATSKQIIQIWRTMSGRETL